MAEPGAVVSMSTRPSTRSTLLVTLVLCFVCSVVVSGAVVLLRPIQLENRRVARDAKISAFLEKQPALRDLLGDVSTANLEERVVDLRSGIFAAGSNAAELDVLAAAREPATSRAIPPERDLARIQRQALFSPVIVVRQGDALRALILPVYGRGYASLLRGYIAIAGDGNTILGLIITEHGDTPGIGSEVAEQEWLRQWTGKKLRDEEGQWRLVVTTDESTPQAGGAEYRIDGISGATQSSQGVANMVRFWLGDDGFAPLLARVRQGELQ